MTSAPAGRLPEYLRWIKDGSPEDLDDETAAQQWAAAVAYIETGPPATLATINRDGRPQQSVVWVGVEDGRLVIAHTLEYLKVKNMRRDPRVSVSFASGSVNSIGIYEYLVIEGLAEVTVGGARSLLERLSKIYIPAGGQSPPVQELDDGWVTRITPTRIRGWGPWQRANPM